MDRHTADVRGGGGGGDGAGGGVDFAALQLSDALLRGVADCGFSTPSPIQMRAVPLGCVGADVVGQAKSGTGKTLAFALILLANVERARAAELRAEAADAAAAADFDADDADDAPARAAAAAANDDDADGDADAATSSTAEPAAVARTPLAIVLAPTREVAVQARRAD